ncbi:MAG: cell division protein FtsA [Candidatus Omnitrophica bacterium]|nr:cell division protein FtsA [Candidatus Omnitrophota bacterium]
MDTTDLVFALDIGTRKVVGLVARRCEANLRILDVELVEHSTRTMLDGQIHNINEVAKIVAQIKQSLEQRMGISLRQVGVAVAGRALKTERVRIERNISPDEEIGEEDVRNLELEAISSIIYDADHGFGHGDYYCVGYSVINYELDGAVIGSLPGHFGRLMSVEVIATFLPRVVLDSMLSVLRRAGLEIVSLTLEPIAAINVIIPQDIRCLNLALLDIGAGTSDIAMTKDGTIFAFGMVPEAGDEITEILCEKFILDFTTAERVKRAVTQCARVQFRDILGREHDIPSREIIEAIRPRVRKLAESVTAEIRELNKKTPHAVILVGGGSLTPLFETELAAAFPLDASNIGIRLPRMISGIEDATGGKINGPEMVTPLGICIMTARASGLQFIELSINGRQVQVLDMQQSLNVLSALIAAGVDKLRLYGRIGRAICCEVNDQLKVIKGEIGKPACVTINGEKADLTAKVVNGDRITFEEAKNGEDASAVIRDVIQEHVVHCTVNGTQIECAPQVLLNGFPAGLDTVLTDRVTIECSREVTAADALKNAGIDTGALQEREIVVMVNKEPRVLSQSNFQLMIDDKQAGLRSQVKEGSIIDFQPNKTAFYKVRDVVDIPPGGKNVTVVLNGQQYLIKGAPGKIFMNGQLVDPDEFLIDRAEILTRRGENVPPTVSQVLEHFSFRPDEQKGKLIKIIVDGRPGGFTTELSEGMEIMINFVERR